jgi:hypothetical protein
MENKEEIAGNKEESANNKEQFVSTKKLTDYTKAIAQLLLFLSAKTSKEMGYSPTKGNSIRQNIKRKRKTLLGDRNKMYKFYTDSKIEAKEIQDLMKAEEVDYVSIYKRAISLFIRKRSEVNNVPKVSSFTDFKI